MAVTFAALTASLLLPARSPILPAVEVKVTDVEASGATKLLLTMLFCADNVIEFEAFSPAPRAKPPAVAVSDTSVPDKVAPAADVIVPAESTLNVAPAAEAFVKLVLAPVFWMNTSCPAAVALAERMVVFTTIRVLPARSPMLPAVEVRLIAADASVEAKFDCSMLLFALRVIEPGAVNPPDRENPPVVEVRATFVAEIKLPAAELTVPLDKRLNTAPAPESAVMAVAAPVFCRKTF